MNRPKIMWIVGGPPGAGKSGLVRLMFPDWIGTSRHIDADAGSGAPADDDLADEMPLHRVPVSKRLEVAELGGRDFVVESRLNNREPLSAALRLRRRGWEVRLIYLALPKIELCRRRVRARVLRGGDEVEDAILERAFQAALDNLPRHIDASAGWLILDSSGARKPRIAVGAYAQAAAEQPDALKALLPDYPFLPAQGRVADQSWADEAERRFRKLAEREAAIDHLIRLADDLERRRSG